MCRILKWSICFLRFMHIRDECAKSEMMKDSVTVQQVYVPTPHSFFKYTEWPLLNVSCDIMVHASCIFSGSNICPFHDVMQKTIRKN